MQLATPLNDIQLVALMAPHCEGQTPYLKVAAAMEFVAEAIAQAEGGQALGRLAEAKLRARQLSA